MLNMLVRALLQELLRHLHTISQVYMRITSSEIIICYNTCHALYVTTRQGRVTLFRLIVVGPITFTEERLEAHAKQEFDTTRASSCARLLIGIVEQAQGLYTNQ